MKNSNCTSPTLSDSCRMPYPSHAPNVLYNPPSPATSPLLQPPPSYNLPPSSIWALSISPISIDQAGYWGKGQDSTVLRALMKVYSWHHEHKGLKNPPMMSARPQHAPRPLYPAISSPTCVLVGSRPPNTSTTPTVASDALCGLN